MGVLFNNPELVSHSFIITDGDGVLVTLNEIGVLSPGSAAPIPKLTPSMAQGVAQALAGTGPALTIYEDHFPA